MIGQDELAEAARYNDAMAEEQDYATMALRLDVDPDGLMYVAHQRALRVAMLFDGQDPRTMSRTEKTAIELSEPAQAMLPQLQALAMDGIMIGLTAKEIDHA